MWAGFKWEGRSPSALSLLPTTNYQPTDRFSPAKLKLHNPHKRYADKARAHCCPNAAFRFFNAGSPSPNSSSSPTSAASNGEKGDRGGRKGTSPSVAIGNMDTVQSTGALTVACSSAESSPVVAGQDSLRGGGGGAPQPLEIGDRGGSGRRKG